MDLKEKVIAALKQSLGAEYIRIEDHDGISGFVVTPQFEGVSSLQRQDLIDAALAEASEPITRAERRQILMIAGLTPAESDAAGAGIRVHRIKELPDGSIEIMLRGDLADAEYVRGAFLGLKGVKTTEPRDSAAAEGIMMLFSAKGTRATPLTKTMATQALEAAPTSP